MTYPQIEPFELDVNLLVADILCRAKGGTASGNFTFANECVEISLQRKKGGGSYDVTFDFGGEHADEQTTVALLSLKHEMVNMGHLFILLLGRPLAFGEFDWKAFCPATRKLHSSLYLDNKSSLFMSRGALGKGAPESCGRKLDDLLAIQGLSQRLEDEEKRTATLSRAATKPNARPKGILSRDDAIRFTQFLRDLLTKDIIFAQSGLPMPKCKRNGERDISACIHDTDPVERLPKEWLDFATSVQAFIP